MRWRKRRSKRKRSRVSPQRQRWEEKAKKLKTNLRLSINRLKLLEKKKTELALKSRKEIADYIAQGKAERAKIRVEHIIREDYLVEAMELIEMFCDLLLARFGLIQQGWDANDFLRPCYFHNLNTCTCTAFSSEMRTFGQ